MLRGENSTRDIPGSLAGRTESKVMTFGFAAFLRTCECRGPHRHSHIRTTDIAPRMYGEHSHPPTARSESLAASTIPVLVLGIGGKAPRDTPSQARLSYWPQMGDWKGITLFRAGRIQKRNGLPALQEFGLIDCDNLGVYFRNFSKHGCNRFRFFLRFNIAEVPFAVQQNGKRCVPPLS